MIDDIPAMLRRLDATERNQSDFAKTMTEVIGEMQILRRLMDEFKTERAVRLVEDKHLAERLDRIEVSIKAVHSLGRYVLFAFFGSLIATTATFIVNGGLRIAP